MNGKHVSTFGFAVSQIKQIMKIIKWITETDFTIKSTIDLSEPGASITGLISNCLQKSCNNGRNSKSKFEFKV